MKQKTIKEWFEELPSDIKAEAIYLATDSGSYESNIKEPSLSEALLGAFNFDHQDAKTDWFDFYNYLLLNGQ
jgi:hypothetical protein